MVALAGAGLAAASALAPPAGHGPGLSRLAYGQQVSAAATAAAAVKEGRVVPVRVATVKKGRVRESLAQTATLTSARSMAVYSAQAGIVAALLVEEGDRVEKGQVLLRLEDQQLALELERARIKLERERREWERQKAIAEQALSERREYREARFAFELKRVALERLANERRRRERDAARVEVSFQSQLASEKERDDARYLLAQARFEEERAKIEWSEASEDWKRVRTLDARSLIDEEAHSTAKYGFLQAQADFGMARLRHSLAAVRAAQAGVVVALEVREGDYVSPATRLGTLEKLDSLEAVIHLPEVNWRSIRPGLKVRVSPQALPGVTLPAFVKRKSPTIDPQSGTFKVTIALPEGRVGQAKPGMFATLHLELKARPGALLVPRQAVMGEGTQRFLFVVEQGRAKRRTVKTGAGAGDSLEILAGVRRGERVVTVGQYGLKPGSPVRVVSADGKALGEGR